MNIREINGQFCIEFPCGTQVPVKAIKTILSHIDNTVLCIKIVRNFTGLGLVESKNAVLFVKMAQQLDN